MGYAVLILGESGSGKSASLRNFNKGDIGIINVMNKPLPFKNDLKGVMLSTTNYEKIWSAMEKSNAKSIVIDDSQFLMTNEFMEHAFEKGYEKFTVIGKNFWDLVKVAIDLPDDKIVYFLHHVEKDDTGMIRAKTIGKLLNDKVTLEGMFTVVLRTMNIDGKYIFKTQSNGFDTVKSPIGMFADKEIDNDLKYVDDTIRKYERIEKVTKKEETK